MAFLKGSLFLAGCLLLACLMVSGCRQRTNRDAPAFPVGTPGPVGSGQEDLTRQPSDQDEQRIRALTEYAVGRIRQINDDGEGAMSAFLESAKADPSNERLVLEMSHRLLKDKQTQKALDLLSRATALPQASGAMHAWYGLVLAEAGQKDKAIKANRTAIQRAPKLSLPYRNLAQLYQRSGQSKAAVRVLKQAFHQSGVTLEFLVEVTETAASLRPLMGRDGDGEALKPEILAALEQTLQLNPPSPIVQQRIADHFRFMGAYDRAAELYRQQLDRFAGNPGFREVLREKLLEVYLEGGNRKAAQELLESVLRETPTNAQVYLALGSLAVEAKEYTRALEYFEKAHLLNPALEMVYYKLAGLLITMNKSQAALDELNKARRMFSPSFLLERYAAMAYSQMKQYADALKCLTAAEVVARATATNQLNDSFYFQLGAVLERNGDYTQAEKNFRKCLELTSDNAEAMNYLGYMWAEQGMKLPEARKWIEKALELEPGNAAFLDSMGWVLFKMQRPRPALKYLQKAIQLSKEPDSTLYDHLGDIHVELGDREKARQAWRKSIGIEPNEVIRKKLETGPTGK